MCLRVFMVMGHCLHHTHFPVSAGWFPFRSTEEGERCTVFFIIIIIELVAYYHGITGPYVIMKVIRVTITSGSKI